MEKEAKEVVVMFNEEIFDQFKDDYITLLKIIRFVGSKSPKDINLIDYSNIFSSSLSSFNSFTDLLKDYPDKLREIEERII